MGVQKFVGILFNRVLQKGRDYRLVGKRKDTERMSQLQDNGIKSLKKFPKQSQRGGGRRWMRVW